MAHGRRNRKVLDAVSLEAGETVEVVSVVEVGTLRPSPEAMALTAAMGVAMLALGRGLRVIVARTRCGLVLTDRRLVLVEASTSGKMLGVVTDARRDGLRRSEVSTRAYLWFDVADTATDTAIRLSFPLPNRSEGRQVADAIALVEQLPG